MAPGSEGTVPVPSASEIAADLVAPSDRAKKLTRTVVTALAGVALCVGLSGCDENRSRRDSSTQQEAKPHLTPFGNAVIGQVDKMAKDKGAIQWGKFKWEKRNWSTWNPAGTLDRVEAQVVDAMINDGKKAKKKELAAEACFTIAAQLATKNPLGGGELEGPWGNALPNTALRWALSAYREKDYGTAANACDALGSLIIQNPFVKEGAAPVKLCGKPCQEDSTILVYTKGLAPKE